MTFPPSVPPITPEPIVVALLREYRQGLIERENAQQTELARAWVEIERKLAADIIVLAEQIARAAEGGRPTAALMQRQEKYIHLREQVRAEIEKFVGGQAVPSIEREQQSYGELGIRAAQEAIRASYTSGFGVSFNRLGVDAVRDYVGLLGNGRPLNTLLRQAYPLAWESVQRGLLDGLARGQNPTVVARNIVRDNLSVGLDRILLIARTEQLRVYRLSTTQQYRVSGVVSGFRRLAARDFRTCLACLVSDGEFFKLEQELTDHPRGRCSAVPVIIGEPDAVWQLGSEWLKSLPEKQQREIMGDARFDLWKSGKVKLFDFRRTETNKTWGDSPRVATVKELRGKKM